MAYCTQSDILDQMDDDVLIQLTDDDDEGTVDGDKVTRAVANADAEIDGYCGVRYSVPFAAVPDIIRAISVDIAIFNLYARRRGATPAVRDRYDDRIAFLKNVAKGLATLGEDDPDGVPSETHAPQISSSDRLFTRDSMEGW